MIHKFVSWGKAFIFLGADKHHENEYELQSVQCTHIPKIEKKAYLCLHFCCLFMILLHTLRPKNM